MTTVRLPFLLKFRPMSQGMVNDAKCGAQRESYPLMLLTESERASVGARRNLVYQK